MQNIERFEKFVISQKGLLIRDDKALIMEMGKYPGHWDFPGVRVDVGEDARQAFDREIAEELGIENFKDLGVIHYHAWYLPSGQGVCGVANLIKNKEDDIILSKEHLQLTWISEGEIDNYKYIWPEMNIMIKKGFAKYKLLK